MLNLLTAIELRVQEIEALLASLGLGSSANPVAPVGPVVPVASTTTDNTLSTTSVLTTISSVPAPSVYMWNPLGGAGPLVPCGEPGDITTT